MSERDLQPAGRGSPPANAPEGTTGSAPRLLIVWHSRTGTARQMAEAARDGALEALRELDATARVPIGLRRAAEVTLEEVLAAQGYLFCAPENLATLSGEMKEFFDRCYYGALDRLNGRPYLALIAAGSDGSGAVRQLERICTGWRLRPLAPAHVVLTQAQTPEAIAAPKTLPEHERERCRTLGATMAAWLA
ncbi:MAG: NAD(P)H-dependent oxidoreductase [Rhodocyclales bacterium]|nr:NAD(P)H-dependent oxidoreductase [Rhodocyclales bacterium]